MATAAAGGSNAQSVRLTLWILLTVYVFNFIDRQIVNILAEPIARDLKLSDTQIGLMTGLAFALFYTVLGIPIAHFADRPGTNRPRLIAVALALWSAMTALCGLAQNFVQLLLARIGVGVGEAGCTPPAHSLIADIVTPERRASALAFYSLGIPLGTLLGMIIGGTLVDWMGWREAFVIVGLPGVALALVVWFVLKDPRRSDAATLVRAQGQSAELPLRQAVSEVIGSRAFVLLLLAGSAASFLAYGKTTWTTIFFQRTHDLTPGQVGLWFGLLAGAAGMLGTWLGAIWLTASARRTAATCSARLQSAWRWRCRWRLLPTKRQAGRWRSRCCSYRQCSTHSITARPILPRRGWCRSRRERLQRRCCCSSRTSSGWGWGRCSSGCCQTCCNRPMARILCATCSTVRRCWGWFRRSSSGAAACTSMPSLTGRVRAAPPSGKLEAKRSLSRLFELMTCHTHLHQGGSQQPKESVVRS